MTAKDVILARRLGGGSGGGGGDAITDGFVVTARDADGLVAAAPSLFAEVLPGQGGTGIGEWKQPDSTNPYQKGDKVTHNGKTWESTADNNVWEPGVYGWTEV